MTSTTNETKTTKPTTTITPDRIEKQLVLRAPRSRVWRALTDSREFSAWFAVRFKDDFVAGKTVRGAVDIHGNKDVVVDVTIVALEPEHLFSYRWHPYAVDPKVDYSSEPTTLVEFRLADEGGGTRLTVVESGFERIPAARRAEAFKMNDGGWSAQLVNIERHVGG